MSTTGSSGTSWSELSSSSLQGFSTDDLHASLAPGTSGQQTITESAADREGGESRTALDPGADADGSCVFVVLDEPVPKGRPRFTKTGRPYTPSRTKVSEWRLREHVGSRVREPLRGPIRIDITIALSPVKTPKKWQGIRRPTTRPDIDNYLKTVLDALNGIVFVDDSQVVECNVRKKYAWDCQPGWYINVRSLDVHHQEERKTRT
jgi:Holliday junction resolvase RusA-like endonuclease